MQIVVIFRLPLHKQSFSDNRGPVGLIDMMPSDVGVICKGVHDFRMRTQTWKHEAKDVEHASN